MMWWQMYFAAVPTKYIVLIYLRRNYIWNGVESGVESGVECSETNVLKLRFGINFRDACISNALDAFLSIFLRSQKEDIKQATQVRFLQST
jgi:hypothetical protein